MKLFSVMIKRDDLPAMTLPLVLLFTAATLLFTAVAAALSSDTLGVVASLPFLALSACLYSMIILLWRRVASLAVTPIMFAMLLLLGHPLFTATTVTLSLLFTSYLFAVSLIAGESRFQRLTSLSIAVAVCTTLSLIAYAGLNSGSYDAFRDMCMNRLSESLGRAYDLPPNTTYVRSVARGLLVNVPAYLTVTSIAVSWFTELLAKSMLSLLGCRDLFIRITHRITLPLPYAVIYITSFALTVMTLPEQSPLTYTLLTAIDISMMLPCAAVGCSSLVRRLRARIYYTNQKRTLSNVALVMVFALLGVTNAVMLLSVLGVYFVIADIIHRHNRRQKNERREWE